MPLPKEEVFFRLGGPIIGSYPGAYGVQPFRPEKPGTTLFAVLRLDSQGQPDYYPTV